jgi:protein tyrosine phosphatase (PTP) superfamily phosphohydrolase (DUF442 family)
MRPLKHSVGALAVVLIVSTAGLSAETGTAKLGIDRSALPEPVEGFEMLAGEVHRDGRVYLAGQPSEEALRHFHELGVTAVVNLRTPGEMDNRERVPFDEAAVAGELGMDYVPIPLGGDDHPYTPEAVAAFAVVLAKHPGPVLLHCTVAWRASYMWVAYLIQYQDFPLDAAMARGEAVAISPPPLQGLLGKKLKLVYDE